MLHTTITAQETYSEGATHFDLEYSLSSRLLNLDELGPRVVHLGLNDSGRETHTLTFKKDGTAAAVELPPQAMQNAIDPVRAALRRATWNDSNNGPRFPASRQPLAPTMDFDDSIEKLARVGRVLYNAVWTRLPKDVQKGLRSVAADADLTIQITRYDQNFVFPWTAVYDFDEPAAGAPVCRGFTRAPQAAAISCQACLANCQYPDKSQAVCVWGFWGYRHQVEQVLHPPQKREDAITSLQPVRDGAVLVSVGLAGGIAATLGSTIEGHLGKAAVRTLTASEQLLDVLWDDASRPAVLVLLGHNEKDVKRDVDTVTLPKGVLGTSDITNRVQKASEWTDPHTVVVLAACDSVGADVGTLTSFLSAFADARASAVVGTEVTVFEALAARIGDAIATAMMRNEQAQSLGATVLALRRALLVEGDPLGFVITPYGNADLVRASPEATT
jgi:hypothetical protein